MASRTRTSSIIKKELDKTVLGIVKELNPAKYCLLRDDEIRLESEICGYQHQFGNNKPFECVLCHKTFKKVSHYKRHLRDIHSKIKKRIYKCVVCEATFKRAEHLKSHSKEVHSKSKSRVQECALCHFAFKRPSHLARHLEEVHYKVRPYKCEECTAEFARKPYLQRHMKRCSRKKDQIGAPVPEVPKQCEIGKISAPNEEDQIDAPIPEVPEHCEILRNASFLDGSFGFCTIL